MIFFMDDSVGLFRSSWEKRQIVENYVNVLYSAINYEVVEVLHSNRILDYVLSI